MAGLRFKKRQLWFLYMEIYMPQSRAQLRVSPDNFGKNVVLQNSTQLRFLNLNNDDDGNNDNNN